jgi:hypothetical protein
MEEEKELGKDEISAIVRAYDRARNVQANINISTDFINAERQKREFFEITLPNVLKEVRQSAETLKLYVDYDKYYTGEIDEAGEPKAVYTGIKSEEIEIDFILPNEKRTSVIFSIKGMSLEEVVAEILRRIDL